MLDDDAGLPILAFKSFRSKDNFIRIFSISCPRWASSCFLK